LNNSFLDGPFVPKGILGRGRVPVTGVMRSRYTSGFALELIEQSIEVVAVEDDACALSHRDKMRAPSPVERASFDADVGNRLGMSESSPHEKAATEGQGGSRMASRPGGGGCACGWIS